MAKYCDDCGCKINGGICSNCHQKLFILEYQGEFVESVSQEFLEKAKESEIKLAKLRRNSVIEKGDSLDYDIEDEFRTKRRY